MASKLLLLRWLTAGLFVSVAVAVQGTDSKSWALAIIFSLPILWKGSLRPSLSVPWKTELMINAILAPIAAVALLSIDGVAQPKLSAALVLALFGAATATRYAAYRAEARPSAIRTGQRAP
jgi:hypothetical protein